MKKIFDRIMDIDIGLFKIDQTWLNIHLKQVFVKHRIIKNQICKRCNNMAWMKNTYQHDIHLFLFSMHILLFKHIENHYAFFKNLIFSAISSNE